MRERNLVLDGKQMSDDAADVLEAAALLQVTEFDLFRIAWRKWHGGEIGTAQLERHYRPYRVKGQVPVWVHQLTRRIVADAEADRLSPARYGVRVEPPVQDSHRGPRYGLWIAVIVGILLAAATLSHAGAT